MIAPPALEVAGLEVRYGTRVALTDVAISVRPGELVVLAGPNGSGKTTLLRAILGLVPPVTGTIRLDGAPATGLRPLDRARRVAWVPQEEPARDNIPLLDYVLLGRFAHRGLIDPYTHDDVALARTRLEEVGLGDRLSDGVLSMSGGERQRAILARALVQEAPLLLLDEPTSHLDIAHQLDLLERVHRLTRGGPVTVLAALHDLNLAARFADRIVVLSRGRKVADGPPAAVLSEELLRRVWGVAAELKRDAKSGVPYLIPYSLVPTEGPAAAPAPPSGTVHVVGGGGAASPILRALTEGGYTLTAGALHLLDSDSETAQELGVPIAEEVPFAPLGDEVRARNRELLARADAIVVAPFAVGPSNLANLTDLLPFVPRTPVYLFAQPPIEARDFAQGRGAVAYRSLRTAGAIEIGGIAELLPRLRSTRPASAAGGPDGRLPA